METYSKWKLIKTRTKVKPESARQTLVKHVLFQLQYKLVPRQFLT